MVSGRPGRSLPSLLLLFLLSTAEARLRPYTQNDPELGWVAVPNLHVEDAFANKKRLTINSQGFRDLKDFSPVVPKGKTRVLCSGASFTFGTEVHDEETWCHQLSKMESHIETINMGMSAYGIDQSYLRFQRVKQQLDYDTHIFAFISDDFNRMRRSSYEGKTKPMLQWSEGKLESIEKRRDDPIGKFRIFSWFQSIAQLFGKPKYEISLNESYSILGGIISDLEKAHGRLILVHLPTGRDVSSEESDRLGEYLKTVPLKKETEYIDLIEDFKNLKPSILSSLFVGDPKITHYSPEGHRWVAQKLIIPLNF